MENKEIRNELLKRINLCVIVSLTVLAIIDSILNRILDGEIWILPVIITGTAVCWWVLISNKLTKKMQLYLFFAFAIFLEFYYCVSVKTIYECGTVIVLMIFIFAFSKERPLILTGIAGSVLSLVFHLITVRKYVESSPDIYSMMRAIVVFLMIPLAAFLVDFIVKTWSLSEKSSMAKIDELSLENERVNNFLANVSHEIRTPVGAVIGLSHVLQKSDPASY